MKNYKLTINGQKYEASISEFSSDHAKILLNGNEYYVEIEDNSATQIPKLERAEKALPVAPQFSSSFDVKSGAVKAPLPGLIFSIAVKEGSEIKKGEPILILEAMKMQSEIAAPVSGKITKIHVKEKALVQEGEILITIQSDEMSEEMKPEKAFKGRRASDKIEAAQDNIIHAPLPGTIVDVPVSVGEIIEAGQTVLILEAMKMESEIHSPVSGTIKTIHVSKGASVKENDALIELEV
ncbi:MAG: biotin/lipoyl-containing protein [Candidatus Cloacimonadaceae bacterium]